jgi:predicted NBD/HSP70 family sugar kinase
MLGVGIVNIISVLDPDLIVLGGGIAKGAPEFMLSTVGKVVQHVYKENAPPIKLSALEDKAQTFGAIRSALDLAQQAVVRRL